MGRNFTPQAITQLTRGAGEPLRGDAGLILLKGLLQSGVAYLGGYPGAPTSTLYDAIADAYQPVLKDLGIHFDNRADHVGSLLRPPELLSARHVHDNGRLTEGDLRQHEDSAILEVLVSSNRPCQI